MKAAQHALEEKASPAQRGENSLLDVALRFVEGTCDGFPRLAFIEQSHYGNCQARTGLAACMEYSSWVVPLFDVAGTVMSRR